MRKQNVEWHDQHPMPKRATLDERVRWHVAHAAACGCRPMPPSVAAEVKRRRSKRAGDAARRMR